MASKTLADLEQAGSLETTDLLHIRQGLYDRSGSLGLLESFLTSNLFVPKTFTENTVEAEILKPHSSFFGDTTAQNLSLTLPFANLKTPLGALVWVGNIGENLLTVTYQADSFIELAPGEYLILILNSARQWVPTYRSAHDHTGDSANGKPINAVSAGASQTLENRMITAWPWVGKKIKQSEIVLAEGETGGVIGIDPKYIFVGTGTSPAKIIKINKNTFQKVGATLTLPVGDNDCRYLISDGEYLYAALETDPAKIVKINIRTMEKIAEYAGSANETHPLGMAFNGNTLCLGVVQKYEDPPGTWLYHAGIREINPEEMSSILFTEMSRVIPVALGQPTNFSAFTFDGTYFFLSDLSVPYVSIHKKKMGVAGTTSVSIETGYPSYSIMVIDGILYAYGAKDDATVAIHKINIADMTSQGSLEIPYARLFNGMGNGGLTHDGYNLFITTAQGLFRINPATMTKVGTEIVLNNNGGFGLTSDGAYLYIVTGDSPTKIIKRPGFCGF